VHEAMAIPEVDAVVAGAMDEMLNWLKLRWDIPHDFLEWYAGKELRRFRSRLLYDPVARVAREPLRKLEMHGRLIGAAQMCLTLGIVPANVLTGITGALLFENVSDPDHHLILLRRSMPDDLFNSYILGLRPDEPLDLILREQIGPIIAKLETFPKVAR
jgi:mannitol-1-phosphate/altronate dehydrogenase